MSRFLTITALMMSMLFMPGMAQAADLAPKIGQQGDAYVLKMPGIYSFHDVMEMLKVNLFEQGWTVRDVHNVDIAMRKHGRFIHNKVLRVSNPKYISDAIEQNQMNALALTQDILVYQESKGTSPLSYGTKPGDIVMVFLDPMEKSRMAKTGKLPHGSDAVKDLRMAIEQTAAFFAKTEVNQLTQGK